MCSKGRMGEQAAEKHVQNKKPCEINHLVTPTFVGVSSFVASQMESTIQVLEGNVSFLQAGALDAVVQLCWYKGSNT